MSARTMNKTPAAMISAGWNHLQHAHSKHTTSCEQRSAVCERWTVWPTGYRHAGTLIEAP